MSNDDQSNSVSTDFNAGGWYWSSSQPSMDACNSYERKSDYVAERTSLFELERQSDEYRLKAALADQQERLEEYWHRHAAPSQACPKIGDKMQDGTTLAGISPDTGEPMYVTPADAPLKMEWKRVKGYVKELNRDKAHGYKDWRSPTADELRVLFDCSAAIGGFRDEFHWGGTVEVASGGDGFRNPIFEHTFELPYGLDFSSGRGGTSKHGGAIAFDHSCALRPVRG